MEQKQWVAIIFLVIIDVILGAIIALALGPLWIEPNLDLLFPALDLAMAPLAALAILLVPTIFFLRYGWPDKIPMPAFLLPLRLGLAYEFLHGGVDKLIDTTYTASSGIIGLAASIAPSPWVQSFMAMLETNYVFFLMLIAVGELLVGLSLLFGGFTRLGALGGILMQWSFLFLLGFLSVSTFGINFIGALAFLVVGMHRSGRYFGLDQILGPKLDASKNAIVRFLGWWT